MRTFDTSAPVSTTGIVTTVSTEAAPRAAEALAGLLVSGLTGEEISRLADLRVRAQRGAYADDGYGTIFGSPLADRRLEFARWLVRNGHLDEGLVERRNDSPERVPPDSNL